MCSGPTTISTWSAGGRPPSWPLAASLSSFTSVLTEDFVQLDFQLPPTKKVRSAVEAATTERGDRRCWNRRGGEIGEEIIDDALSDEDEAAAPELPRAHSEGCCCCCAAIAGARAAAIRQGMMKSLGEKERAAGGEEKRGRVGKGKKRKKKSAKLAFSTLSLKFLGSRSPKINSSSQKKETLTTSLPPSPSTLPPNGHPGPNEE